METDNSFNAIECIEKIHQHSADSHLKEPLFEVASAEIKLLADFLQCSAIETVLFANAFAVWYRDNCFSRVFKHFGMQEFQVLKYRKEILALYSKNLLINKDKSGKNINEFDISQSILINISENTPPKICHAEETPKEITLVDILEEFNSMSDLHDEDKLTPWEFRYAIDDICGRFADWPFFQEINRLRLSNFETYFLLDTVWDAVRRGDNDFNTGVHRTSEDYFKQRSNTIEAVNSFLNGQTLLIKKDLIVLSKEQYRNRINAKLSDRMVLFLKEQENLVIDNYTEDNKKLITSDLLPLRELYYNDDEHRSINQISEIISPEKFKDLQKKLQQKNMLLGISILLHGAPGTGKTESVYQIAKKTGRNIFKVDISETKSMWFGESQKLIKKVFTDYRDMCKYQKQTPILLFNEADGIISKRKSTGSSNVADTENAIQNIILEELENFEGILFATTNLVENMDAAFERRFLFKVKFEKPVTEVSAKIWKLKLPFLTEKESFKLAEHFQFSGGEMENIARKCVMNELLENQKPDFDAVFEMCRNEKWEEKTNFKKIGF